MKQFIFILTSIFFISLSTSCSRKNSYKEHINKLNEDLPKGNEHIQVDKMDVKNDTFFCFYTILSDMHQSPSEEELEQSKHFLRQRVKDEPTFRPFREDSLHFSFIYKNKKGDTIIQVNISPKEYK